MNMNYGTLKHYAWYIDSDYELRYTPSFDTKKQLLQWIDNLYDKPAEVHYCMNYATFRGKTIRTLWYYHRHAYIVDHYYVDSNTVVGRRAS